MGNIISHTIVGIFSALIMFAVIAAVVIFGGRGVAHSYLEGQRAIGQQASLLAQNTSLQKAYDDLKAQDQAAAGKAEAACDARVRSAQSFASTLSKYAAPAKLGAQGQRPFLGAGALDEITQ